MKEVVIRMKGTIPVEEILRRTDEILGNGKRKENSVCKKDLIEEVVNSTGLSRKATKSAIDSLLTAIENSLHHGRKVNLTGFGTFYTDSKAAVKIPEFKAGRTFRKVVSCEE